MVPGDGVAAIQRRPSPQREGKRGVALDELEGSSKAPIRRHGTNRADRTNAVGSSRVKVSQTGSNLRSDGRVASKRRKSHCGMAIYTNSRPAPQPWENQGGSNQIKPAKLKFKVQGSKFKVRGPGQSDSVGPGQTRGLENGASREEFCPAPWLDLIAVFPCRFFPCPMLSRLSNCIRAKGRTLSIGEMLSRGLSSAILWQDCE